MKQFLGLILLFFVQYLNAQKTIVHCGQLIDVKAGQVLKEMTIEIEGNKIANIVKGYTPAGNAKLIDLKTRTVMPGLIDSHVHLEQETKPTNLID